MYNFNALVLHRMGNPRYRREAVRSLEYMIPESRPDLNCIVHDTDLPFPDYMKDIDYHLIVLGPTFLCNRYDSVKLKKAKSAYSFINESQACKVALPQDDYDCSAVLDEWMFDWDLDCIYTVCPEHWEVLYPKSIKKTEIRLGYTGYISDKWIDAWKSPKHSAYRTVDVSYRASKLGANFGRIGQLKWEIADRFKNAVKDHYTLKTDISIKNKDLIPGSEWHDFLENSRFCLATPSGSSLLDPVGHIRNCVNRYSAIKPSASFDEFESRCFKGEDGKYSFVAISPRNVEAALAETVQIATPSHYSGLMSPAEHYLSLDEDCGNIQDVLQMMKDESLILNIKKQCKDAFLSEPRLRQKNIVNEIIEYAKSQVSKKNLVVRNQDAVNQLFNKYQSEINEIEATFWKRKYFEQKIKSTAVYFGARRVRDLINPLIRKA